MWLKSKDHKKICGRDWSSYLIFPILIGAHALNGSVCLVLAESPEARVVLFQVYIMEPNIGDLGAIILRAQSSSGQRWYLGVDEQFHITLQWACNYLSMPGVMLFLIGKRGPRWTGPHTTIENRSWDQCKKLNDKDTITMSYHPGSGVCN